jgi:peptidoglycan/xylan/chitin deacetylase (PgdA/CDA1 family)
MPALGLGLSLNSLEETRYIWTGEPREAAPADGEHHRMAGSIASHIARRIGHLRRVRPVNIAYTGGAVSFSFDDFPKSALATGGAILEKYGLRGTYYAALGLAGSTGNVGPIAELAEMREAHQRGHELACHTYSHLDCSVASAAEILAEIRRNAEAMAALIDGFAPSNFAYPFGRYLSPAKRLVAPRFDSCRGTSDGINHRGTDLADLRATRVYAPLFDENAMRRLIDRACKLGGWLIFYTHDVTDTPSRFGCTPRQWESIVAYAAERAAVLPVCEVLARVPVAAAAARSGEQHPRQPSHPIANEARAGE